MIDFTSVRSGSNSGVLQFPQSLVGAMGNVALNMGMRGSSKIVEAECTPEKFVCEVTGCGVTDKNTYSGSEADIQQIWRVALEAKRLLLVRAAAQEGGPVQQPDQAVTHYLSSTYGVPYVALLNSVGLPVIPEAMETQCNDLAAAIELALEDPNPTGAFSELLCSSN